MLNGLESHPKN